MPYVLHRKNPIHCCFCICAIVTWIHPKDHSPHSVWRKSKHHYTSRPSTQYDSNLCNAASQRKKTRATRLAVLTPAKKHPTTLVASRHPAPVLKLLAAQLALLVAHLHAPALAVSSFVLRQPRSDHVADNSQHGEKGSGELHGGIERIRGVLNRGRGGEGEVCGLLNGDMSRKVGKEEKKKEKE